MRLFITLLLVIHTTIVALAWRYPQQYEGEQYPEDYPSRPRHLHQFIRDISDKRGAQDIPNHIVNITQECIKVTVQTGHFYFRASTNSERVCGLYLLSKPDTRIEITVTYMDAPCANNSVIEVVDGWELSGQYFPSTRDHGKSIQERTTDSCGSSTVKKIFLSSQNAALIEYRLTQKGHSFAVVVNHIHNHRPCNILVYGSDGEYSLSNYGRRINCSLTSVQPSIVRMVGVNVGNTPWPLSRPIRQNLFYSDNCVKRGLADYVEIGGSDGLDSTGMIIADSVCGLGSDNKNYSIQCEVTTIRLVSSGLYNNNISADIKILLDEPPFGPSVSCLVNNN